MFSIVSALRRVLLSVLCCLVPVAAWSQAIVLLAAPMVILSFNGHTETLNFHTSCSSPLGLEKGNSNREERVSLIALLTRSDGSEIGRVEYVRCPSRGGFGTLDFRAEIDNFGDATIYVDDVPFGKVKTKQGRVTIGVTPLCNVPCPEGIPVSLDGVVIGRDSGETQAYVRYTLRKNVVSSYNIGSVDDD
jgi:hypothetical protein